MKRLLFMFLVALTGLTGPTLHAQIVTDLVLFAPPDSQDADHTSSTVISLAEIDTWIKQTPTGKMAWIFVPGATPLFLPSETISSGLIKANGLGVYRFFYTVGDTIYLEELIVN